METIELCGTSTSDDEFSISVGSSMNEPDSKCNLEKGVDSWSFYVGAKKLYDVGCLDQLYFH